VRKARQDANKVGQKFSLLEAGNDVFGISFSHYKK
jgi:hypothetical protein